MLGVELHLVPVFACYVHEMNPKLDFGIFRVLPAASNPILLITRAHRFVKIVDFGKQIRIPGDQWFFPNC